MLLGLPEFEMVYADTVDAASGLLSENDAKTQLLAGGTDLLVLMKHKREIPRRLINIKRIPDLDGVDYDPEAGLSIGALATIQAVENSFDVAKKFPSVAQAASVLGTSQIRNLGTLGGNLANASPSAEFAPPLLTLDAAVCCQGPKGGREIGIADFFLGPGESALAADELLTGIRVPNPPAGSYGVYLKHSLRRMDVAIASAAVSVRMEGDVCLEPRIALGAVAPTPFRAGKAEAMLAGETLTGGIAEDDLLEAVGQAAADESRPIDDFRGFAGYRRKVVMQLVIQALEQALERIRG